MCTTHKEYFFCPRNAAVHSNSILPFYLYRCCCSQDAGRGLLLYFLLLDNPRLDLHYLAVFLTWFLFFFCSSRVCSSPYTFFDRQESSAYSPCFENCFGAALEELAMQPSSAHCCSAVVVGFEVNYKKKKKNIVSITHLLKCSSAIRLPVDMLLKRRCGRNEQKRD